LKRICDLAEEGRKQAAVKSQFAPIRSVDVARNDGLKQEFLLLARRLQAADTDDCLEEEKMTDVMNLRDFTLRVI
jgi:hypothetical protein